MENSEYLNSDEEDYDIPHFLHLEFRDGIHVIPVRRNDRAGNRMGLIKTLKAPFKCALIDLEKSSLSERKSRLEDYITECKLKNSQKAPEKNEVEIVWLRHTQQGQADKPQKDKSAAILPLLPDFTEYVSDADMDIPALKLSQADRERTMVECRKRKSNLSPAEPE